MGSLGKLSQFSGIKASEPSTESEPTATPKAKVEKKTSAQPQPSTEKLVTVNIKIRKEQKDWLAHTASQVRENNDEPVAPSFRVYPQHLIGVAIDLLQSSEVDWSSVHNIEELKEQLNL